MNKEKKEIENDPAEQLLRLIDFKQAERVGDSDREDNITRVRRFLDSYANKKIEDMKKEIEDLKIPFVEPGTYNEKMKFGYNQAIKDILSILSNK